MKLTEHKIPVLELTKEEYSYMFNNAAVKPQTICGKQVTNILPDGKEIMLEGENFYRLIVVKS